MASRGLFFGEGPTACPFVALEGDRDRRSEEPDHRHRCYAEPEPAPRALAHQREYCLAAAFTTCPIFQDWAVRAAATPVPVRPAGLTGLEREPDSRWTAEPLFRDDALGPGYDGGRPKDREQLADGFVSPPARGEQSEADAPDAPSRPIERLPSLPLEDGRPARPPGPPVRPVPPRQSQAVAATPADLGSEAEPEPGVGGSAAPPPFLADRATEPPARAAGESRRAGYVEPRPYERQRAAGDRSLPAEKLRREDVVPPWGREPLYPLETRSRLSLGGSGSWISRITTLLAILVILSLAVTAVILAPSLLGGAAGNPNRTAPVAGGSPSPVGPTATPRRTPTPAPTPITYTIQPGDTLFSIALRHGLTVEQLLAANPEITNPDLVQIGQQVIIPGPDFPFPSPSASPEDSP